MQARHLSDWKAWSLDPPLLTCTPLKLSLVVRRSELIFSSLLHSNSPQRLCLTRRHCHRLPLLYTHQFSFSLGNLSTVMHFELV